MPPEDTDVSLRLVELAPVWTELMAEVIGPYLGKAFPGDANGMEVGGELPPWRWFACMSTEGHLVAYVWMSPVGNDGEGFEVSLVVYPALHGEGFGTIVLGLAEQWIADQGARIAVGVVRRENEDAARVATWLLRHGYETEPPFSEALLRAVGDVSFVKSLV